MVACPARTCPTSSGLIFGGVEYLIQCQDMPTVTLCTLAKAGQGPETKGNSGPATPGLCHVTCPVASALQALSMSALQHMQKELQNGQEPSKESPKIPVLYSPAKVLDSISNFSHGGDSNRALWPLQCSWHMLQALQDAAIPLGCSYHKLQSLQVAIP